MIKLLVVDDEKFIRKGLITTIEWGKLDIEIVGEAENGKKALEKIKKFNPQIIICDVKMPVMDGLEVARYICENGLNIKMIILSGYDDFKYAQKAIKYGVREYLLKPAGEENLIKSIINIKDIIEKEEKELKRKDIISAKLNASISISRENYLKNILYGYKKDLDDIDEKFKLLDINLESQFFTVINLNIVEGRNYNFELEEITQQINDIVKHHISIYFKIQDINISGSSMVFIINKPCNMDEKEFVRSIKEKGERIIKELQRRLNIQSFIGIGYNYIFAKDIRKSFHEALISFSYAKNRSKNILYIGDFKLDKLINNTAIFDKGKEFELTLRGGDLVKINEMISSITASCIDNINNYKKIAIHLMIITEKVMYDIIKNNNDKLYIENIDYSELINLSEIISIEKYLKDNIGRIIGNIINQGEMGSSRLISSALEYIKKHYNKKASVQNVSEQLGLNADYFSYLFKKETGKNFIDVLNEYRIEKAKEYLKSTNYKIYEVANMVGFNDNRYFSTLFKRYVGCTPSQFSKRKLFKQI
jgi:two-component system response regulator YesN